MVSVERKYFRIEPLILDPGEGVCADPVNGGAILGKGGSDPKGGNKERQLSLDKERDKTWYVVRWEDDKRARKTNPSRLQDASMNRVSWCAQLEDKSERVGDVYIRVLTVFIVSGK